MMLYRDAAKTELDYGVFTEAFFLNVQQKKYAGYSMGDIMRQPELLDELVAGISMGFGNEKDLQAIKKDVRQAIEQLYATLQTKGLDEEVGWSERIRLELEETGATPQMWQSPPGQKEEMPSTPGLSTAGGGAAPAGGSQFGHISEDTQKAIENLEQQIIQQSTLLKYIAGAQGSAAKEAEIQAKIEALEARIRALTEEESSYRGFKSPGPR